MATTKDQTGQITLYRVPRRYVVAFVTALALLLVQVFELTERLGGDDQVAMYVERGLEAVVVVATYFGWKGLASWLADPKKGAIG